jgi:hypothetical protein
MLPNMSKREGNSNTEIKTICEELRGLSVELKLPIVSGIQTNRGGFSSAELDLTDVADSIGSVATADIFYGVSQSDELRAAGLYSFTLLKNRYGLNKIKTLVGVDYPKMRVYDITPEGEEISTEPLNLVDPNVVNKYETMKKPSTQTNTKMGGIKF